jgi:hypothetical protein
VNWYCTQIGEDVYVIIENFAYKDPRVELVPGDGLVQLYFKLAGNLTMSVSRTEPLRLNRPTSLNRAHAFLMKQLAPAPTIRQVARIAGMNETTLKRSFPTRKGTS